MSAPHSPTAAIEVKTSFFPLAFILLFFKPKVSIDGTAPFPVGWGQVPVPVPPGRHQVEVWVPYLFLSQAGKNGIIVDVPEGGIVQVWWKAPWILFLKGSISATGPAPFPGLPDGPPHAAAPWTGATAAPPPAARPLPPAAPAAPAAAWHADPSGRHEQRYHDGSAWTDHVVDGGVQSTDPVGG